MTLAKLLERRGPDVALRSTSGSLCFTFGSLRFMFGSLCSVSGSLRSGCYRKNAGLTLVELLVTVSIMGLVVAISVPIIKPMLASNKVKSGADIVVGFLAQARNRAIEENRPVGVTFERVLNYEDNGVYPYNGACVIMRQVAEPRPLSGFVKDVRVAVDCSGGTMGEICFCDWNGTDWVTQADQTTHAESKYWSKLVEDGDQIQFDAKGSKYTITKIKYDPPDNPTYRFFINPGHAENVNLPWPTHFDANHNLQPVLFKVFRKPQATKVAPTMAMPVILPEGMIVDLDSSGMGNRICDARNQVVNDSGSFDLRVIRDDFCAAGPSDRNSVTIMFSPIGEVDRVYYSFKPSAPGSPVDPGMAIPSGPIFLNIGIWDRTGFWMEDTAEAQNSPRRWYISDDYLPDESQRTRNYQDMNNYWVTIFPRTGATRVNRVAPVTSPGSGMLTESRKNATSLHGVEAQ